MKLIVFVIAMFCGLYSGAQENTFTLTELDSITATKEIKRDSTFNDVPVFKGCEKWMTFAGKKKCVNEKIANFLKENYNTKLPDDSKVKSGKIKINLTFSVDEEGNIVDGKADGPSEHLENEAIRVLKLLPKFSSPGYINGKAVKVPYSIPVVAVVINKNDEVVNATYPIFRGCKKDQSYEDTKKCTTEKIMDYIKVSFNYELADKLFPTDLTTKFYVEFKINKKGRAEQINVKANHKAIAIDVIQLIKRMPKFKMPGTKNGESVETSFSALMTVRLLG